MLSDAFARVQLGGSPQDFVKTLRTITYERYQNFKVVWLQDWAKNVSASGGKDLLRAAPHMLAFRVSASETESDPGMLVWGPFWRAYTLEQAQSFYIMPRWLTIGQNEQEPSSGLPRPFAQLFWTDRARFVEKTIDPDLRLLGTEMWLRVLQNLPVATEFATRGVKTWSDRRSFLPVWLPRAQFSEQPAFPVVAGLWELLNAPCDLLVLVQKCVTKNKEFFLLHLVAAFQRERADLPVVYTEKFSRQTFEVLVCRSIETLALVFRGANARRFPEEVHSFWRLLQRVQLSEWKSQVELPEGTESLSSSIVQWAQLQERISPEKAAGLSLRLTEFAKLSTQVDLLVEKLDSVREAVSETLLWKLDAARPLALTKLAVQDSLVVQATRKSIKKFESALSTLDRFGESAQETIPKFLDSLQRLDRLKGPLQRLNLLYQSFVDLQKNERPSADFLELLIRLVEDLEGTPEKVRLAASAPDWGPRLASLLERLRTELVKTLSDLAEVLQTQVEEIFGAQQAVQKKESVFQKQREILEQERANLSLKLESQKTMTKIAQEELEAEQQKIEGLTFAKQLSDESLVDYQTRLKKSETQVQEQSLRIKELEEELVISQEAEQTSNALLEKLDGKIIEFEQSLVEASEKLDAAQKEAKERQTEFDSLKERFAEQTSGLQIAEELVRLLTAELQQVNKTLAAEKSQTQDALQRIQGLLQELEDERQTGKTLLDRLSLAEQKVANVTQIIQDERERVQNEANLDLAEYEAQVLAEQQKQQAELDAAKAELEKMEQEFQEFEAVHLATERRLIELVTLREQLRNLLSQSQKSDARLEQLNDVLALRDDELAGQREQIRQLLKDNQAAQRLADLREENLQASLALQEKLNAEIAALQTDVKTLRADYEAQKAAVSQLRIELSRANSAVSTAADQNDQLQKQLQTIDDERERLETEREKLSAELKSKTYDLRKTQELLAESTTMVNTLRQKEQELQESLQTENRLLNAEIQRVKQLENQVLKLTQTLESTRENLAATYAELANTNNALLREREDSQRLGRENKELEETVFKVAVFVGQMDKTNEELGKKLEKQQKLSRIISIEIIEKLREYRRSVRQAPNVSFYAQLQNFEAFVNPESPSLKASVLARGISAPVISRLEAQLQGRLGRLWLSRISLPRGNKHGKQLITFYSQWKRGEIDKLLTSDDPRDSGATQNDVLDKYLANFLLSRQIYENLDMSGRSLGALKLKAQSKMLGAEKVADIQLRGDVFPVYVYNSLESQIGWPGAIQSLQTKKQSLEKVAEERTAALLEFGQSAKLREYETQILSQDLGTSETGLEDWIKAALEDAGKKLFRPVVFAKKTTDISDEIKELILRRRKAVPLLALCRSFDQPSYDVVQNLFPNVELEKYDKSPHFTCWEDVDIYNSSGELASRPNVPANSDAPGSLIPVLLPSYGFLIVHPQPELWGSEPHVVGYALDPAKPKNTQEIRIAAFLSCVIVLHVRKAKTALPVDDVQTIPETRQLLWDLVGLFVLPDIVDLDSTIYGAPAALQTIVSELETNQTLVDTLDADFATFYKQVILNLKTLLAQQKLDLSAVRKELAGLKEKLDPVVRTMPKKSPEQQQLIYVLKILKFVDSKLVQ